MIITTEKKQVDLIPFAGMRIGCNRYAIGLTDVFQSNTFCGVVEFEWDRETKGYDFIRLRPLHLTDGVFTRATGLVVLETEIIGETIVAEGMLILEKRDIVSDTWTYHLVRGEVYLFQSLFWWMFH